jgi:hypothetical protein
LSAFIKLRVVTNEAAAEWVWAWLSAGGLLKLMAGASGLRIGPMERVAQYFTCGFLPRCYVPRSDNSSIYKGAENRPGERRLLTEEIRGSTLKANLPTDCVLASFRQDARKYLKGVQRCLKRSIF